MALLLLAGAVSCGDDGEPADPAAAGIGGGGGGDGGPAREETRPFPVETSTETLVDDSRPTDDPEGGRSASTRTLVTDLYVPDGEGPFPLIVHAHGFDGQAGKYTELLTSWAEAGYVVAAPTFPLTNDRDDPPSVFGDYVNQPADVGFVVDEVVRLSSGDHPTLGGRLDEERIAVSGHSLGGITTYGLLYNDCCREGWDDRIDAVAVMSSLPIDFEGSYEFEGTPLLLILSTDDPTIPYEGAVGAYDEVADSKHLLTLESVDHSEQYEDTASPHDEVVEDATIAFWDTYLLDDPDTADRLATAADASETASLTADP